MCPQDKDFFFLLYRPFDFCRFGGLYVQKENELNVTVCFKHYVLLGLTCQRECCPIKPRCLWNCFIRTRAENPKFCTPSPVGNSVVLALTPAKSGKNNVITKKKISGCDLALIWLPYIPLVTFSHIHLFLASEHGVGRTFAYDYNWWSPVAWQRYWVWVLNWWTTHRSLTLLLCAWDSPS